MKCLSPVTLKDGDGYLLQVKCNHCLNCSVRRQLGWTIRLLLERQSHGSCNFTTLTYSDQERPNGLRYRDIQLFLKRLRRNTPTPVRFFCVGQYGERTGREHWHVILYGVPHGLMAQLTGAKSRLSRFQEPRSLAELPTELWPYGGLLIDELNEHRARYAARYSLRTKLCGTRASEVVQMSRRPGIGLDGFRQIGRWLYSQCREVEQIPGWWRMGKSLYPLDHSSREAVIAGYEAEGGHVKFKKRSELALDMAARLATIVGEPGKPCLSIEHYDRKELERGSW